MNKQCIKNSKCLYIFAHFFKYFYEEQPLEILIRMEIKLDEYNIIG